MRLSSISILLFSNLLLMLPKKLANACGFYVAGGEYRFWLLQPDLTNEQDLTPFFFASSYLYRGNQYAGKESYPEQNIQEWMEATKGTVTREDIDTILNYTAPEDFFANNLHRAKVNSFLQYLLKPANRELYQYVHASKRLEQVAANPDPWGEGKLYSVQMDTLIYDLQQLHLRTQSPFVKLRAAFQLMRAYSYTGETEELSAVYDKVISPIKSASWVKTAALYQKAVQGRTPYADYLLSKVFDKGNYNRTHCLVRFNSDSLKTTLKLAKNEHERNVLYAMKVFNYPGKSLSYITKIFSSEPDFRELPFLLLREINKIEDWLITSKVSNFAPASSARYLNSWDYNAENHRADREYADSVYAFIERAIAGNQTKCESLLHLYAAHLSLLKATYGNKSNTRSYLATSREHLSMAQKQPDIPPNVKTQLKINSFLLDLEEAPALNTVLENRLLNLLRTPDRELGLYDPSLMKDQLILYSARKMIAKGDRAKGIMLLSRTRRAMGDFGFGYKGVYLQVEENAKPDDYDRMIHILDKQLKTGFERFITTGRFASPTEYYSHYDFSYATARWDRNKLLDGKASLYIKQNNLPAALETLRLIPDSFWRQYPYDRYINGNPFFMNIHNARRVTDEDKMYCNKKEVVEEMVHLLSIAPKQPDKKALYYYQLGNAWYNMSYYGKNWLMVKPWRSNGELNPLNNNLHRTSFNNDYFGCERASSFYLKAMKASKDPKLIALCAFMVRQCDHNRQYYLWCIKSEKKRGPDFIPPDDLDDYKNRLKANEAHYLDRIVGECALYTDFIARYNRK